MILDLLFVALLGLFLFIGWKKGLLLMLLPVCSFVLSVFLTILLAKPLTGMILHMGFVQSKIAALSLLIEQHEATLLLPAAILTTLSGAATAVATTAITYAIKAIVTVFLFLLFQLLIALTKPVVKTVSKLPILKTINSLLGAAASLLLFAVTVYLLFLFSGFLSGTPAAVWIAAELNTSHIVAYLFNENPLYTYLPTV